VLLVFTAAALSLPTQFFSAFLAFWKTPLGLTVGSIEFRYPLKHWINDGLMALFFFVVGLEVKREIVVGELRDIRQAACRLPLPWAACCAGHDILLFPVGAAGQGGWGIPMATDIASWSAACRAGARVPRSLRILLLSLAIADDIGAILVIASATRASCAC